MFAVELQLSLFHRALFQESFKDIYKRFSECSSSLAALPISGLAGKGGQWDTTVPYFFKIPIYLKTVKWFLPNT